MAKLALVTNPRRRKTKRKTTAKKRTTSRRVVSRAPARKIKRRRNPIKGKGIIDQHLMPSVKGAAGAIGIDTIYEMLPIPEEYKDGQARHLVKGGAAIGIGMLADNLKILKKANVKDFVNGSLTVTLHAAGKELLAPEMAAADAVKTVQGLGYASTGYPAGSISALENYPALSAYTAPETVDMPVTGLEGLAAYTGISENYGEY